MTFTFDTAHLVGTIQHRIEEDLKSAIKARLDDLLAEGGGRYDRFAVWDHHAVESHVA